MIRKPAVVLGLAILCLSVYPARVADFTLKKIDGGWYRLGDDLGRKVIVIDFWATWCQPCKKLLKRLDAIDREYGDRVRVLAISVDDASAMSAAESYIQGRRFGFTVLFDADSRVSRLYNPIQKIPFTMVIDLQGVIRYTHTGYVPGVETEIRTHIESILKRN